MKRILACMLLLLLLLCGCSAKEKSTPAQFTGSELLGWTLSEDASYSIHPVTGFAKNLTKTGSYYLTTGAVKPAYTIEDGTVYVERYFPTMETGDYWRGVFFASDSMTMSSGETASADITPEVGTLAGICVGTDENLNNGYAAVLNLAGQRVEIYRVNQGVLTSLAEYQDGVSTGAMQVELGQTYKMDVTYTQSGENACRLVVHVNGKELLNTELSGYGVPEGRGQQVSLVTSDMKCSFENVEVAKTKIDVSQLYASEEDPCVIDETFRGEVVSDQFVINSSLIYFKAGGTKDKEKLSVSLIDAQTDDVLLIETGSGSEEMVRYVKLPNVSETITAAGFVG